MSHSVSHGFRKSVAEDTFPSTTVVHLAALEGLVCSAFSYWLGAIAFIYLIFSISVSVFVIGSAIEYTWNTLVIIFCEDSKIFSSLIEGRLNLRCNLSVNTLEAYFVIYRVTYQTATS